MLVFGRVAIKYLEDPGTRITSRIEKETTKSTDHSQMLHVWNICIHIYICVKSMVNVGIYSGSNPMKHVRFIRKVICHFVCFAFTFVVG